LLCLASGHLEIPDVEIAPGVRMPLVSIGTGGLERPAATQITSTWLGLGGRGVDAAWVYKNQDFVRQGIADSGVPREQLFITSKIPGCVDARHFVEDDLKLLNTTYLDLLLIHFPGPVKAECPGTWKVLEDYHARGVLKAIGISNFKSADVEDLLKSAKVRPAVNQIQHNILAHDDATIATCQAHNIAIEAFSPLGRHGHSGDIPGNPTIQAIAAKHSVSSYQVALRWILQHGHSLTFQSSSAKHQAADADLFGFNLTTAEMSTLDTLQGAHEHIGRGTDVEMLEDALGISLYV